MDKNQSHPSPEEYRTPQYVYDLHKGKHEAVVVKSEIYAPSVALQEAEAAEVAAHLEDANVARHRRRESVGQIALGEALNIGERLAERVGVMVGRFATRRTTNHVSRHAPGRHRTRGARLATA